MACFGLSYVKVFISIPSCAFLMCLCVCVLAFCPGGGRCGTPVFALLDTTTINLWTPAGSQLVPSGTTTSLDGKWCLASLGAYHSLSQIWTGYGLFISTRMEGMAVFTLESTIGRYLLYICMGQMEYCSQGERKSGKGHFTRRLDGRMALSFTTRGTARQDMSSHSGRRRGDLFAGHD